MPLITMHLYPGRTPEQKANLVRGLTEVVAREISVPESSVEVLLIEVPREHWAFGGKVSGTTRTATATGSA